MIVARRVVSRSGVANADRGATIHSPACKLMHIHAALQHNDQRSEISRSGLNISVATYRPLTRTASMASEKPAVAKRQARTHYAFDPFNTLERAFSASDAWRACYALRGVRVLEPARGQACHAYWNRLIAARCRHACPHAASSHCIHCAAAPRHACGSRAGRVLYAGSHGLLQC